MATPCAFLSCLPARGFESQEYSGSVRSCLSITVQLLLLFLLLHLFTEMACTKNVTG
jgi:hypothetical protein